MSKSLLDKYPFLKNYFPVRNHSIVFHTDYIPGSYLRIEQSELNLVEQQSVSEYNDLDNLFQLELNDLREILDEYGMTLFANNSLKCFFVMSLLNNTNLIDFIDKHLVELFTASNDKRKFKIIYKLFHDKELIPLIDGHLIELYNASNCQFTCNNKLYILEELFKSKNSVNLLNNHLVELFDSSDDSFKDCIINKLFANKEMAPLIDKYIIKLFVAAGRSQTYLLEKLFNSDELIPLIEKHASELSTCIQENRHNIMDYIVKNKEKIQILLSQKVIDDVVQIENAKKAQMNAQLIHIQENAENMAKKEPTVNIVKILKHTFPLSADKWEPGSTVVESNKLIVRNFLAKTYTTRNVCGAANKDEFTQALGDTLYHIIDAIPSLAKILECAARGTGDIFITESAGIGGGCYIPSTKDIVIFGGSDVRDVVGKTTHECTHKVNDMHNLNRALPYGRGNESSFDSVKKSMNKEKITSALQKFYLSRGDEYDVPTESWLSNMLASYADEDHDVELFAWFTQNMVYNLFGINDKAASGKVSSEFVKVVWDALQDMLIKPLRSKDGESTLITEPIPHNLSKEPIVIPQHLEKIINDRLDCIIKGTDITSNLVEEAIDRGKDMSLTSNEPYEYKGECDSDNADVICSGLEDLTIHHTT